MNVSKVLEHKGRDIASVRPDATVGTAVQKLADRRIGAVLVQDVRGKLLGIFSERDLVRLLAESGKSALDRPIEEVMTTHLLTCRPDDRIDEVLGTMTRSRIRHIPVLDGETLVGIVSIGDLVEDRLREKELEAAVLLDRSRMHA